MSIATRYQQVSDQVAAACHAEGRSPADVRLIAVSKTVGLEGVAEAIAAGACDFGENRPGQILEKAAAFPEARWHFIGNIQSRRIRDIVSSASLIHSVHEERHARKIDMVAAELGKIQEVLIEVNVSGERTKSGVTPDNAKALLDTCQGLGNVRVRGLMTMAPQGDAMVARECFEGLAALAGMLRSGLGPQRAAEFDQLSMGMSEDWREAIAAGATMVRIGRAVFSDEFE